MNMIKCEKGHIYDGDKFSTCIHCSNIKAGVRGLDIYGSNQKDIETELTEDGKNEYDLALRRKTVGFLVCIKGVMLGEGFILREGANDIGRAKNMDVALIKEITVSRDRHACISYEHETGEFILRASEGKEDVFCDGRVVDSSCRLTDRSLIQIGACSLIFISFCDSSFSW
jgi:hypothetical protein